MFIITAVNNFAKLVTPTRLELVTPTLKVWCSTNWAKRSSIFNKKAYMWSLQTILRSHSTNIKLEPTFAVCFLFLWRYRIELNTLIILWFNQAIAMILSFKIVIWLAGVAGFEPTPVVLETNMLPLTPNPYIFESNIFDIIITSYNNMLSLHAYGYI